MLLRPCGEVAGHAIVRSGIDAVGGEVDFKHIVGAEAEKFGCGSAGLNLAVNDDDAVVALTDADFIFGTNHAERFNAAYF